MGKRKVTIKQSVADSIAQISWFIESKGLIAGDTQKSYPICRDPERAILGYKCVSFRRKYTVVFIETEKEIVACELIPSKLIHW